MGGKTPETYWAVNKRQKNKTGKFLHLVGDLFEFEEILFFLNSNCNLILKYIIA